MGQCCSFLSIFRKPPTEEQEPLLEREEQEEQELKTSLIQKTAEKLIDITMTRMLDTIQQDLMLKRKLEYK
jgi:hypothetical protein